MIHESWCPKCKVTFNPESDKDGDQEHYECGTQGEYQGYWGPPPTSVTPNTGELISENEV